MANRLASESSPYLRQHQDNPVDWWPWTAEAFDEARRTGKPIFLSIGYAACHWCHVMAHESFEDPEIAKLMNERYVNIKVDREERPDVDAIYMNAIQVQGEGGGWPLSAWCTPDGKPFFLGTYFPPQPKYGRASFRQMLDVLADAFRDERAKVDDNVGQLAEGLRHMDEHFRRGAERGSIGELAAQSLIAGGRMIVQRCDPKHGGLGKAPKFPNCAIHDLLGRVSRLPFGAPARDAFLAWARGMARGGIYDHLGGGFARYAVDDKWLVPHFEKMLYDQAQLLAIFGDAVAMTRGTPDADEFTRTIVETVAFVDRELSDPAGGLWSSLDADSEGEEGKFYVWTPAQVREVIGSVDALQFCRAFGVTDAGNFEHSTTVLSRVTPPGPPSDEAALDEQRAKLFAARASRIRPGTDDKVLTAWNALAISGLVKAWGATGHAPALALAERVGRFLVGRVVDGERVARVWHGGTTKLDGTLDDYAFTAVAFLDLAEATGDATWWKRGSDLLGAVRERFVTDEAGVVVFYMAPQDGAALLVHRPESHHDGAIPSGSGVAIEGLLRLGLIAGDGEALALAERYLAQRIAGAGASPLTVPRLYAALDFYMHHDLIVVSDGSGRVDLIAAARRAFDPARAIAGPWTAASHRDGKTAGDDGRARAFVCRGPTCKPPASDPAALAALLENPG